MNKYFKIGLLLLSVGVFIFVLKIGFNFPPSNNVAAPILGTPATASICTTTNPNEYICNGNFEMGPYTINATTIPAWPVPLPFRVGAAAYFSPYGVPFWSDNNGGSWLIGKNLPYLSGVHSMTNLPYDISIGSIVPALNTIVDMVDTGTYDGFFYNNGSFITKPITQLKTTLPAGQYTLSFDLLSYTPSLVTPTFTKNITVDFSQTYTPLNGNLLPPVFQTVLNQPVTLNNYYTVPTWQHISTVFSVGALMQGTDPWGVVGGPYLSIGFNTSGNDQIQSYIDNVSILPYTPPVCPSNTWNQKTNFETSTTTPTGVNRKSSVSFSIGTTTYVGTGLDNAGNPTNDFWAWNQLTNTWTIKAPFPGVVRSNAVGFSIGTKGYIGTGITTGDVPLSDFWEYDSVTNTWTQKANFGGGLRSNAIGLSIGTKGYIGTGVNSSVAISPKFDFWEYNPVANTWTQKANFGGSTISSSAGAGLNRINAVAFSIGTGSTAKGYVGTGSDGKNQYTDFWEYTPSATGGLGVWLQKAKFGSPTNVNGLPRENAVGFSIGAKGYIGTGINVSNSFPIIRTLKQDFWEYTYGAGSMGGSWTQKAAFPGISRMSSFGASIGTNRGYIGTGINSTILQKDFYEYCL